MNDAFRIVAWAVCAATAAACTNGNADRAAEVRQALAAPPSVRISEVHYDNAGTDVGEAIEISGPAGTDLTGWRVVLYNGNGGASYNTQTLTGSIAATCGDGGTVVLTYPSNGIQNGGTTVTGTADPDGIALVDASGTVVEFLSYEGSFAATNGPAIGIVSTDVGVRELGTEPNGQSLQRNAAGVWSGPAASTFGVCNDADGPPAVDGGSDAGSADDGGFEGGASTDGGSEGGTSDEGATPPSSTDTRLTELHYDNAGTDTGEAIEVEGAAGTDLTGWTIVLYDGNGGSSYDTQTLSGTIPATCGARGVVVVNYPSNGIQNGSPDGVALVDAFGRVVEFLSYEGTFTATNGPAAGATSIDIGASESSSSPIGQSLQRDDSNVWQLQTATFGACNGSGAPPPPPGNRISFTGRTPSDPALPVGFQDQLFATLRSATNVAIPAAITWSSDTPDVVTVDSNGVLTALAEGTAVLRATADDGTTGTWSLPTRVAVASTTANYAGNAEFGEPTDSDPSDDFIVRHVEYTASFNPTRGTPNWVSYDLDASHFGTEDRCDCFTFDPALPASFTRYTTADYTGAAAFHGYGIDRGHLARSFDRTSASLDNAFTFYFTNVVPQASDLNQGPWAILEDDLGDMARLQNKEVYIVAGVAGSKGTLKNEGKIVIPARTWKVAVVMPRDHGLADVRDYRDVDVIAVDMPNDPGVRNVPWQTYQTTVLAIEALSGYDLLALLPDKIEDIVQRGIKPPIAAIDGPYASTEGGTVTMSAAASLDPNGSIVTYGWAFGDGTNGSGAVVSHTFAQDGVYPVRVTVTDNDGLTDTIVTTVTVANVAPTIGDLPAATLLPGDTYVAAGSFTDPGPDPWSGTIDWGDGTGASPIQLTGTSFAPSHVYHAPGAFTITVRISDDHDTSTLSQVITVLAPSRAIDDARALVEELRLEGKLGPASAFLLKLELTVAKAAVDRGNPFVASVELRAVIVELDALVRRGALSAGDAAPLRALLTHVVHSLSV